MLRHSACNFLPNFRDSAVWVVEFHATFCHVTRARKLKYLIPKSENQTHNRRFYSQTQGQAASNIIYKIKTKPYYINSIVNTQNEFQRVQNHVTAINKGRSRQSHSLSIKLAVYSVPIRTIGTDHLYTAFYFYYSRFSNNFVMIELKLWYTLLLF